MGTGTAGHPSRAFHNETITIYEPRYVEMFTGKQLQSAQADALLAVADMCPVVLLCFHHQAQQAECKGHRSKCVHCRVLSEHMIFFIVPAPQSDSGVVPSPVWCSVFLPVRLWWIAKGQSPPVLHTISSYDNHVLTVQMRKWLIGLVINIMSYYPRQVEKLFNQARLYLWWFTYAPVLLISQLFIANGDCSVFPFVASRWLVWISRNITGYKLFPFVHENSYLWVHAQIEIQWSIYIDGARNMNTRTEICFYLFSGINQLL